MFTGILKWPSDEEAAVPGLMRGSASRCRRVADDEKRASSEAGRRRCSNPLEKRRRRCAPAVSSRSTRALHGVCMLCAAQLPPTGHLHRGSQDRAASPLRWRAAQGQQARPLRHRYALCMYCGICVEVVPVRRAFWSPEYEYSEPRIRDLLHEGQLGEWMETVPEAPSSRPAGEAEGQVNARRDDVLVAQNIAFGLIAAVGSSVAARRHVAQRRHAAMWLVPVLAGAAAQYLLLAARSSSRHAGSRLSGRRDGCCSCSESCSEGTSSVPRLSQQHQVLARRRGRGADVRCDVRSC